MRSRRPAVVVAVFGLAILLGAGLWHWMARPAVDVSTELDRTGMGWAWYTLRRFAESDDLRELPDLLTNETAGSMGVVLGYP